MRYIVTAAAVVAKTDSETGEGYFYRDNVLPAAGSDRTRADHKRLVDLGLVAEMEDEIIEVVVPIEAAEATAEPVSTAEQTSDPAVGQVPEPTRKGRSS